MRVSGKDLDIFAWIAFTFLLGTCWLVGDALHISTAAYVALGVGLILICLNLARIRVGITVSWFTIFIGVIAFIVGVYGLTGVKLSITATIVIMIGLYMLAEVIAKLKRQKQE